MLVLVDRLPRVGLGREHLGSGPGQRDHDGEDLEGEDQAEEKRDLDRGLEHGEDDVPDALQGTGAEYLRGLDVVARDRLEPGEQDDHHERRRAPDLGRGDAQDELRLRGRVEEDDRLVDHAESLEDGVEVAELGEDRRPGDTRGEVGDREREQEDVEEDPAALEPRIQEQRHARSRARTGWARSRG